jgi:hypothetical protein
MEFPAGRRCFRDEVQSPTLVKPEDWGTQSAKSKADPPGLVKIVEKTNDNGLTEKLKTALLETKDAAPNSSWRIAPLEACLTIAIRLTSGNIVTAPPRVRR